MSVQALSKLAKKMKQIDFCQMITVDGRGTHHSRPMSNNKNVDFDGTCYFFSFEDSNKVHHLNNSPLVSLIYQTDDMLFVHLYGTASLITQKGRMEEFWDKSLDRWFTEGLETPGVVMIKVTASKICYWHKAEEEVINL